MIYLDAFGHPTTGGSSGGGSSVTKDSTPLVSPTFYNSTDGRYCRLDDDYPTIEFANTLTGASTLRLYLASADAAVSGKKISLTFTVGGVSSTTAVAVPTSPAWVDLTVPGSGAATLTRNTGNSADTLKSGSAVVSAVITSMEVVY